MNRHRLALVGGLAAVIALVVIGVLFRAHLGHLPLVGRLFVAAPVTNAGVYFCPMHPEVRQEGSGTCPKCGMDLVKEDVPGVVASGSPHEGHEGSGAAADAGAGDAAAPANTPRGGVQLDLRRQQLVAHQVVAGREGFWDRGLPEELLQDFGRAPGGAAQGRGGHAFLVDLGEGGLVCGGRGGGRGGCG